MKHIYFKAILICLCLLWGINAFAYDAKINGIYYWFEGDEAIVTHRGSEKNTFVFASDGNSYSGNVSIPASVTYKNKTYRVTSIGFCAFRECTSLTSVVISNSVLNIDSDAFYGCSNMNSVTIPEGVTSLNNEIFRDCTSLTSIVIHNNVTSIGYGTFCNCTSLVSVSIPNSVTSIGDYAFRDCSGLTSIAIPESVISIGYDAFSGTPWYDNQSDGMIYIGKVAYKYKGEMPEETQMVINDGTVEISGKAFTNCTNLISISIPESVMSIGSNAFSYCTGLNSVIIPNNVTIIGYSAFQNCTNLASVSIGRSVTNIGPEAFKGCNSLTSVYITDLTAWCEINFSQWGVSNPLEYAQHFYINGEEIKDLVIPEGVTTIGNYAFYKYTGLTSVSIPNSVTSIGDFSFCGCTGLTSITIPESVTSIGSYAFSGCTGLTSITIPNSVTSIGYGAFPKDITIYSSIGRLLPWLWKNGYEDIKETGTGRNLTAPKVSLVAKTASSLSLSFENQYPELTEFVNVFGTNIEKDDIEYEITLTGLEPDNSYNNIVSMSLTFQDEIYTKSYSFSTEPLTLTTQQPKVINIGNVVVAADSNLDDEETNVGFEWRRTDWTNEFASNTGTAYLYEGRMEGYIRNLYTEKLWKYRPYYQSNSGNRYYGEWVGIDPTNTSYFEPTVHTYAQIKVNGNKAEVKGYAMRGTDNVVSQGFMYWPSKVSVSLRKKANSVPDHVTVVNASGNVMIATLEDLEYETTYNYVAFVTTSEGETFYGEEQSFSTSVDPDGIKEVHSSESIVHSSSGIYDLSGRKTDKFQKGINIIRYSDGTTKKVLVK